MNEELMKEINILNQSLWHALKTTDKELIEAVCKALKKALKRMK